MALRFTTSTADPAVAQHSEGGALSAFVSPRRALVGHGEALRIELPAPWPDHVGRVRSALESIEGENHVGGPGTGPVAFGALPFDRDRAAILVVPSVVHGTNAEGLRWVTTVADATGAPPPATTSSDTKLGATCVEVRAEPDALRWTSLVSDATERIRGGELTKVVLSRRLDLRADAPFDLEGLLERLRAAYPHSLTFCVDGFIGSSPELLVSRIGDVVRAQPMAGTTLRTGDVEADQRRAAALSASEKNRVEHRITIDMVHDTLLPWCSFLDSEPEPSIVAAGPVQHLATMVEGQLSRPPAAVLELVGTLHPTPAVGGWPRREALDLIAELESFDRGRYAGPVGWMDANGDGAWAVGIRSAEIDGPGAQMFTGVGIVADSDPAAELDETRAKAQALLGLLVRI